MMSRLQASCTPINRRTLAIYKAPSFRPVFPSLVHQHHERPTHCKRQGYHRLPATSCRRNEYALSVFLCLAYLALFPDITNPPAQTQTQTHECEHKRQAMRLRGGGAGKVRPLTSIHPCNVAHLVLNAGLLPRTHRLLPLFR